MLSQLAEFPAVVDAGAAVKLNQPLMFVDRCHSMSRIAVLSSRRSNCDVSISSPIRRSIDFRS
jgi:hypothetical protein